MSVGIRGIFGCVPWPVNYRFFALRVKLAAIAGAAQAPRRAAVQLQQQPQAAPARSFFAPRRQQQPIGGTHWPARAERDALWCA